MRKLLIRNTCFCYTLIFVLFFSLITLENFAQQQLIDSLETVVNNTQSTQLEKSSAYLKLAKTYNTIDKTKSLDYAFDLLDISKEIGNEGNSLNALEIIINNYDYQNDSENSLKYGIEAISVSQKLETDNDIAYFSGLCGGLCIKTGNYFEALQHYQLALSLSIKNNWVHSEASFLNNIAGVYYLLGDELTALDYYIQAFHLKEKNDDTKKLIPGLINIGGIYSIIGDHAEGMKFLEKALQYSIENNDQYLIAKALISIGDANSKLAYYKNTEEFYLKALEVSKQLDDLTVLANVYSKLGSLNIKTNNQANALKYSQKALTQSEVIHYQYGASIASQQLGIIYLSKKDYKLAEHYLLKALDISKKINAVENQLDNYKSLSELYRQSNKYAEALVFYNQYVTIKDSIFNDENHKKYSAVKAKYEVEKKQGELDKIILENEIKDLEAQQSKYFLLGALGLSLLIILVVVLIFRQYKLSSLQRTISLEQKLLRSQINPHFIFNALTAVQRFILEKSTLLASDYLGSFSRLIRFILVSSTADAISIKDEIEFLENYLSLQSARFDNKFKYSIIADDEIQSNSFFIPPMLIQPIVENAVEHGVNQLEKDGLIKIDFVLEKQHVKIIVSDNGVGRVKAAEIASIKKKNHKSISTAITKERLMYLNKKADQNISIKYFDLTDENGNAIGTRVEMLIPFTIDSD